MAKNVRLNPITGELDYYFPMEVKDPADKEYARVYGLEVGPARLGFRKFEAIFIPCKNKTVDAHGFEVYTETPSEVQRQRYLDYIKDELAAQDAAKQDGRCNIPDGHGGLKRCPCRISNPDYVPGGDKPKTLPVRCEGCVYESFRQAHTAIPVSYLDHESEDGGVESYEIPAPVNYYAGDRYCELSSRFVPFVKEKHPKLTSLAKLLVAEYSKSEASRELNKATSTIGSQAKKLQELLEDFLDNVIIF